MCSFNLQWKYRSLIFKHSLYALYDLVILPFLLCIILTVWRLRSLSRVLRLNGHFLKYLPEPPILELSSLDRIKMINAGKKTYMSVHSCITITFLALLLDIPMIPLAIFCAIVAPWRISEIWKIVLAKDERGEKNESYFVAFADIVLGCAYYIVYYLFVAHGSSVPGNLYGGSETSTSSTYTTDIALDLSCIFGIICIVAMILQFWSLLRRQYRLFKLNRIQNKMAKPSQKKYNYAIGEDKGNQAKSLLKLSSNILSVVFQYLEAPELAIFGKLCRKGQALVQPSHVWRYQYDNHYKKYNVTTYLFIMDTEYKNKVIEAHQNKINEIKKLKMPLISEEIRDMRIGPRFIIFEELVYSIIRLPHLFCIPVKFISFIFPLPRYLFYKLNQVILQNSAFCCNGPYYLMHLSNNEKEYFIESEKHERSNFWRIQDALLGHCLVTLHHILEIFSYGIAYTNYTFMKILSAGGYQKIIIIDGLRFPENTRDPQQLAIHELPYSSFIYSIQAITFPIIFVYNLLLMFLLPLLFWYYTDYDYVKCLHGPYCLNIFWYAIVIVGLISTYDLARFFPYYNPYKGATIIVLLVVYFVKVYIFQNIGIAASFTFKRILKPIAKWISFELTTLLQGIFKAFHLIFILPATGTINLYFTLLRTVVSFSAAAGILGEVVLLVFGIVWMFWPVALAYYLGKSYYLFIPAGVAALLLLIHGRKIIKEQTD